MATNQRILNKSLTSAGFDESKLMSLLLFKYPNLDIDEVMNQPSSFAKRRKFIEKMIQLNNDIPFDLMECCFDNDMTTTGDKLIAAIIEEAATTNLRRLRDDKEVVFGMVKRFFAERTDVESYEKMKELLKKVCLSVLFFS